MPILINDTAPRSQYTATSGQTVFSVPFEFFANSDLKVYRNSTLLTLTTNYTVTGAGVTGGGSVTFVTGATAGDIVTITRNIAVQRVTDFPTSGPFNIEALNTDLDRLTAMMQEREDGLTRVVQLSETDTSASLQLPSVSSRASKVLGFDISGNTIAMQEIGNYRGNWATSIAYLVRDLVKDSSNSNIYICLVAHTSTGSTPISSNADIAKWALLVDAATATAASSSASTSETNAAASASAASSSASSASGSASSASTSASNAASAQTAAESARDATLAAYDNFDDRYLGAKASDPSVDNDGNALVAGALYFNSTDGVMKLYTGSAWVAAYVSGAGFLAASSNLSDLASAPTARTNLGLGTVAVEDTVPVSKGGTGATTLAANNVLLGNGTSAPLTVAPSTSGNVLTSNGTSWTSAAAPVAAGINVQTFNASGTWTKPAGYAAGSRVYIQAWGAGGSGSRHSTATAMSGGGGGGYSDYWITLSAAGATETVTIGAGGAARTGSNQNGAAGGNSSFGSIITAYGGGFGTQGLSSTNAGGGGGGPQGAASGNTPGAPLIVSQIALSGAYTDPCCCDPAITAVIPAYAGAGATTRGNTGPGGAVINEPISGFVHGGGGAGGTSVLGAPSSYGGGGGGGVNTTTGAGGVSLFGGNGGAAGVTAVAGSQPGGGGGGGTTTSGAGGAGRVIITVFPA